MQKIKADMALINDQPRHITGEYPDRRNFPIHLNDREIEFLKLVCTELTYKEMADRMCLSPRTIDGYRDVLFQKLQVKTRVGLVLFAIRNGIVSV